MAAPAAWGPVATALWNAAVAYAANYAITKITAHFTRKPSREGERKPNQARLANVVSTAEPRRKLYGRMRVGGLVSYSNQQTTGEDSFFHEAICWTGNLCDGIEAWYLDGDEILPGQLDGSGTVTSGKFLDIVNIRSYLGTETQLADPTLVLAFSEYTAAHRGLSICYSAFRYTRDEEIFGNSTPTRVHALVRGAKVYDPRKDSTVGGAGAHRVDNPATWEWSNNMALCARDYLCDPILGMGLSPEIFPALDLAAAANECDETLPIPGGGTQKRYTCDGLVITEADHKANLEDILSGGVGTLLFPAGKVKLYVGGYDTPSFSLNEDDLAGDITGKPLFDQHDLYNAVKGIFPDANRKYQPMAFQPRTSAAFELEDNDQRLYRDLDLPMTSDEYRAQRIAKIWHERSRRQGRYDVPLKTKAGLPIQEHDVGTISIAELGWVNKSFRVAHTRTNPDLTVNIEVEEEDSAVYTWTAGDATPVNLPAAMTQDTEVPPAPSGLVATGIPDAVILSWSNPAELSGYTVIDVWRAASNNRALASTVFTGQTSSYTDQVADEETFYYWIRARAANGQESAWYPLSATGGVVGTSSAAGDAAGNGINIMYEGYSIFTGDVLPPVVKASVATLSLDTSLPLFGRGWLKNVASGIDAYVYLCQSTSVYNGTLAPNGKWIVSAYVKASTSSVNGQFWIRTSNGSLYSQSFQTSPLAGTVSRVSVVFDLTSDNSTGFILRADNDGGAGRTMWFTAFMVEAQVGSKTDPSPYVLPNRTINYFFQDDEPAFTVSSPGDFWIDTNENNKIYRYSGTAWVDISTWADLTSENIGGTGTNVCPWGYATFEWPDPPPVTTGGGGAVAINPFPLAFGYGELRLSPGYVYLTRSLSYYPGRMESGKKWWFSVWVRTATGIGTVNAGIRTDTGNEYMLPILANFVGVRGGGVIDLSADSARSFSVKLHNPTGGLTYWDAIMIEEKIGDLGPSGFAPPAPPVQIHDQRILPTINTANRNSVQTWSGGGDLITAVDNGLSVRIDIKAHQLNFGYGPVSYNSGTITGLLFETRYHIYCVDPPPTSVYTWPIGGVVAYVATVDPDQVTASPNHYYVGSIETGTDGGGSTGGGGGGGWDPDGPPPV